MKKIFISILSAAMFAACAKTETEDVIPVNPEPEDEAQTVYVEIGATTGSNTKATYDKDLKAYWEAGDQILAVQGSATSKTNETGSSKEYTANAESLMLSNGDNTNEGTFNGNITVHDSNNRYFHFAYPSNTTLRTITKTNGYSGIDKSYATTTTCSYTVPSEQDGKWTPFLCTSTTEKTTAANITNIDFGTSLNACLAVRVFYHDGKTPKPVKRIRITSGNNIVGTISATTANDGAFSANMFASAGGGTEINADNLHTIAKLGNNYEYRFEVLPVESGKITLTLSDESGSQIIREANSKIFAANTRSGVNVYWDDATISMDEPLSWYEDTTADKYSTLKTDVIYVNNVAVHGVGTSDITEVGVYINGTKYPENNVYLSFNKEIAAYAGSGVYTVKPYAVLSGKGEITGEEKSVIVTGELSIASHTIRSSYNNNGTVAKTNDLNGDKIYAAAAINDAYAAVNLIESATLHYGGNTFAIDAKGSEVPTGSIAYQQYSDCYAEIVFKNGYTLTTPKYTVNVTGIPYSINFTDGSPAGWATNNTSKYDNYLQLVHGTAWIISPRFIVPETCDITTTINAGAYRTTGTYNPNIYISISNIGEAGGTPTKLNGGNALNMSYQDISRDLQIGIEDNNSHICIYSSGNKPNWATNNTGIAVKTCNVKYK